MNCILTHRFLLGVVKKPPPVAMAQFFRSGDLKKREELQPIDESFPMLGPKVAGPKWPKKNTCQLRAVKNFDPFLGRSIPMIIVWVFGGLCTWKVSTNGVPMLHFFQAKNSKQHSTLLEN